MGDLRRIYKITTIRYKSEISYPNLKRTHCMIAGDCEQDHDTFESGSIGLV